MSCLWCNIHPIPKITPVKRASCGCGSLFSTDLGWEFLGVDSHLETSHDDLYYRTYEGGQSVVYRVADEIRLEFVDSFIKNCFVYSIMSG